MRSRHQRWAARAGLCLALGLVTTVAVAWACAWRHVLVTGPMSPNPVFGEEAAARGWPLAPPAGWQPPNAHDHIRSLGVDQIHVMNTEGNPQQAMLVVSAGLPARSMVSIDQGAGQGRSWKGGIVFVSGGRYVRLPVVPLGSGFATDTLLYAAAWFASLTITAGARRGRRCRRGLCPACRYDLRHDLASGCPECGWGRAPP